MSIRFELLRASIPAERERWTAALAGLPVDRQDVYFAPAYLQPFARTTAAEACCALVWQGQADRMFLYPFLRERIDPPSGRFDAPALVDLQSPYGYGGPVVNAAGENTEFLAEAWAEFSCWCAAEKVVTEFVRFHPLVENVRWAAPGMKTFEDRTTIPIMLKPYPAAVWDSPYYRPHRHMLRKAEKVGFTFHVMEVHSELSWFVPLYVETQDFLQAGAHTRFGMDYFSALAQEFGSSAWLGVVKLAGEIKAAVIVLEGPVFLHSYLMGYRRDVKTNGMTNLIYHGIALEGAKRGKTMLHMGGGRTSSSEDSLLKFKEALSPERTSFWLGTRCHDVAAYEALAEQWEARFGARPKNYLQFYRLTGPSTPTELVE